MAENASTFEPVLVESGGGRVPVLFVCEHASATIPERFGNLGIGEQTLRSHVAWDPGALDVARLLARRFDAPLVRGGVSRLLYDCNRAPEAPDAIPKKSELYSIPGNADLSEEERDERVRLIYRPFETTLRREIEARRPKALVTVHSFTPVYFGRKRKTDIGLLHDADSRLTDAMLSHASELAGYRIERNQPYGPGDGVMHTLRRHGEARGLLHVMIEIRNDLIATGQDQAAMAEGLGRLLQAALADCAVELREAS